jgi:hypothetical protein
MPDKKKPPMGEMAYATAFIALLGVGQSWISLGFGTGYFSWKRLVVGITLLTLAGGIWYRKPLARVGAIFVLAAGAINLLVSMLQHELNLNRLAWVAALLWCCWVIWRGYEDEEVDPTDDSERHRDSVALVSLLSAPLVLDEATVAAAAQRTLGPESAVFGGGMFWAVRTTHGVLRISSAARPFFADRAADTTHADEHRAVREHSAWLSVEVVDPRTVDLSVLFPMIARLIADMSPENALAIHATSSNEFVACRPGWKKGICENQPFKIPQLAREPAIVPPA